MSRNTTPCKKCQGPATHHIRVWANKPYGTVSLTDLACHDHLKEIETTLTDEGAAQGLNRVAVARIR